MGETAKKRHIVEAKAACKAKKDAEQATHPPPTSINPIGSKPLWWQIPPKIEGSSTGEDDLCTSIYFYSSLHPLTQHFSHGFFRLWSTTNTGWA